LLNNSKENNVMKIGGDAMMSGMVNLQELPREVYVGGSMDISGCIGIKSWPARMVVGEDLDLRHCTGLKEWPEVVQIGGVYLPGKEPKGTEGARELIVGGKVYITYSGLNLD
jgi:hypothetical protein